MFYWFTSKISISVLIDFVQFLLSAADYHVRHLELARSLQDSSGELAAYANLAADYLNLDEPAKAAYFHVLNRRTAKKVRVYCVLSVFRDAANLA